jgi:hypothetical protein
MGTRRRSLRARAASCGRALTSPFRRHASPVLAVVGHHDCAARRGSADEHRAWLPQQLRVVQTWGLGVKLIALWVNADWRIDVVRTRGADVRAS